MTTHLITDAQGQKIGKTTQGALWLDPQRTSPFAFYQYWINTSDENAIAYLKYFSDLTVEEVYAIELAHRVAIRPGARRRRSSPC